MNGRLKILDIWVDPVNMQQALDRVSEYVEKGDRLHTVFASNPEKNFSIPSDDLLYRTFRSSDLLIPDGIGMVLAARILYGARLSRVPGCELMENICAMSAQRGYSIFIYGAHEEVNRKAVEILAGRYPGLRIAGRCNGYVPEDRMDDLVETINRSGAQVLFIALGSPAQERWISMHAGRLTTVRVCQGTGGTLDVIAGSVKRAPEIYCRMGLEWLYRLVEDPSRIRRQKVLPLFAALVLLEKARMVLSHRRHQA
jgi:N-acetylglucosaminyldiphosphoundecaprenol N-acetyl-beta-D-mannosaminyltransferase